VGNFIWGSVDYPTKGYHVSSLIWILNSIGVVIVCEFEMVHIFTPLGCFDGFKWEGFGVEEDSKGLNPCVVSATTFWPVSNEASIDLNGEVWD